MSQSRLKPEAAPLFTCEALFAYKADDDDEVGVSSRDWQLATQDLREETED